MKLEVGMYVRTKYGIIEKIEDVLEFDGTDYYLNSFHTAVKVDKENDVAGSKGQITRASFNIRDLIEVGDYVNGHLVTKISKDGFIWLEGYDIYGTWNYVDFINEWGDNIKSIVTKEQFESMKYEVK